MRKNQTNDGRIRMLRWIHIDQALAIDENISFKAVIVFDVLKYIFNISEEDINSSNYIYINKVLLKKDILQCIPLVNIQDRTLSTVLSELKNSGLIEQNLLLPKKPTYNFTIAARKYLLGSCTL